MYNDYVYFKHIFRMYTTEDVGNKYEHLFRRKRYINYGKSAKQILGGWNIMNNIVFVYAVVDFNIYANNEMKP